MAVTVTKLGPWSVNFPVAFYSGGDTTREAFGKHRQEIARIYDLLNALDSNKLSAGDIDGTLGSLDKSLQEHINSTNPHPKWKPSLSFEDITGNLDGSRITGTLTNAYIDADHVNNLKSFIEKNAPDKGDGITGSDIKNNGYVKFNNGLILQWATRFISDFKGEGKYSVTFPVSFESGCYGLSADIVFEADDVDIDANSWVQILQSTITKSGFAYRLQSADSTPDKYTIGIKFIAIGI